MIPVLRAEEVVFRDLISYPTVDIFPGEATFLTGPSGCGKSTLLRLFNATVSPASGRLLYQGRDLETLDPVALRREVLLAGQSAFLFPGTIGENFAAFYAVRDQAPPGEGDMADFLALCQVPFGPDAPCDRMSGGERQRVFLAVCLSFYPRVLLLDEPTSALDAATAEALLGAVKDHCRAREITLVAVSHDEALARQYADRRVALKGGRTL